MTVHTTFESPAGGADGRHGPAGPQDAIKNWHREKWLGPRKLLSEGHLDLRSALLPFWLFDTTVEVSCTASVALPVQDAPPDVLCWQPVEESFGQQHYSWALPNMQVGIAQFLGLVLMARISMQAASVHLLQASKRHHPPARDA